jgi:two-component system sensor histidine kinase MtrB
MTDLEPHQLGLWTEACGDFLMGYGMLTVGTGDAARTWLLVQALPNDPTTDPLWELREVLTANSVFIVIGAVLVAAVLAAMVAHPVARARTMAEAVAAGDLDVRIPVRGRDEVARMSTAVNTMADRLTTQIAELEHANETQRRFVSDVAHELRTPTAALLASAEALGSPATLDAAARQIAPQLHRLVGLTEDLLELGRMDAGQAVVASGRIDLVDLVREVVAETDVGGAVALSSPESLEVSTDPARARVVVRNLVANALQHGTPPVAVEVGQSATSLTVTVHDEGAGVPTDLRDRVFDRFVRGDESRHGASSGLGLSIARENAHLLGGELELRPDGRTFVLTLPGAADQR